MIFFKWVKTVCLQELRASFCGVLNELSKNANKQKMYQNKGSSSQNIH